MIMKQMSTLAWVLLRLTGFVLSQSFTNPIIGFYPGTSTIPSKQRYNVTIALILPYKSFWNFTSSAEYKNCGSFCSWMRQMDSGAEMAVSEINNNPKILPDITVNILRVQGWDQKISPGNGIGGAAPVAIELSERRDVIGVVGDVTDQSSMITAGILSQYHMPICGGSPNLPDLSNKANYPFYFRVAYSNKWGSDIASLLQEWNVKRVALVYDADDSESVGACFDITQSLFRSDVIVLSKRSYHGLSNRYDYDSIIEEFLLVDTRYIILCAQAWSNSYHFIQKAAEMGLITPQHQWIVTQPPYPPDYTGTGIDPRLKLMEGMIYVASKNLPALDPNFKAIQSRWEKLYKADPLKYQIDYLTWTNKGTFDCVGTLLYGFDKVLKSNSSLFSQSLVNRQLQPFLTSDKFQDTGFNGTLLNPVRLDSFGDIAANTIFIALNSSFWVDNLQLPFGEVDKFTGQLKFHGLPILSGGNSHPPKDGPPIVFPTIFEASLQNAPGQILFSLILIGNLIIAVYTYALYRFWDTPEIRPLQTTQTLISTIGSGLLVNSLSSDLNQITHGKCIARQWLLMLGLSFLICPLLMKAILVYIVYTAKTKQRKKIRWYSSMLLAGTGFLIAVNASILGWWQSTQSYEPIHYVVKGYEYIECNSFITVSAKTAGAVVSFVLAFTLFALLVIVLLVSHVHPVHNETNVVVIFCSLIVILAVPIKFLPFDENYAIREAIVIWMIGIYVPVTRITPKLYEIFARINHKTLQPQFTSNASQNSQLFTSIRDRRLISDTTQTSIRENHSPKAKIKSLIGLTSFRVRSRWRLHSSWIAVSQSTMCFVNTKLWIELVSNDGIYTFPILQDTHLEEKQSKVQVITKAGARKSPTGNDTFFSGYDLEVGFENCNEKKSLISDIHKAQLCVHNELKT